MQEANEWRNGWKIVLGCALGAGTGVVLLFFTFSIFVLPLLTEFHATRGQLAAVQSLVIAGAVGAPVMGRAADIFGFRKVFITTMLMVIAVELWMATMVSTIFQFGVGTFLLGLIGAGTTAVTITRPVNAWFDQHRGMALGLAASGLAVATIIAPPFLEAIVAGWGWRFGLIALATVGGVVGLPAVYFLVQNEPPQGSAPRSPSASGDWVFLKEPQFWLMALSLIGMGVAGSGFIGQMSPMVQQEGLSAKVAAVALSAFATGQVSGRMIGGWCLDRFDPRIVAVLLNLVPASGFILLWLTQGSAPLALLAAFLIGFQQGAEIDIFAYFTARRFGIANYGTVYGALIGLGWIGNATGVIGVGYLHDLSGDYGFAQMCGALALTAGALLITAIRLPPAQVRAA